MRHAILIILFSFAHCITHAQSARIYFKQEAASINFAASELEKALSQRGIASTYLPLDQWEESPSATTIILTSTADTTTLRKFEADTADLQPEGFRLQVVRQNQQPTVLVVGADPAGAMYGGLEVAEQISVYGLDSIQDTHQNPYMAMRGTKFNIPLDARTPSYSDLSDAAQHNIAEMWSWDFWTNYIDNLARYRYNFISLWNLHPFPSLVKLDEYPDIALDDVMRSRGPFKEDYSLQGKNLDAPEIINNLETVKSISIEDKIDFWQRVMRYGKERNVDFYIITWNIFTYGTQNQYGITDDINNPTTIDYFRKSVQALVETYPDLKGVGLTTGENIEGAGFAEKEGWAYDTYGQGILNAVNKQQDRKITFVHRQHQAGALDIADKFQPLVDHPNIDFIFSFKYAKAHVYSATQQPYHQEFVKDIQSRGNLKTIWTLRNDDIYYFRWGAPDYVREFIKNIPYEVSQGYYYGSDQYIWGREFLSRFPESPRQLEVEKHWYHWMLWGRLGYNPDLSNERFSAMLQARFPEVSGEQLLEAWQHASMIYPITTGFHWGPLDFHWYIEGNQSRASPQVTPYRFNNVNYFTQLPPHPLSGNIAIPDFVKSSLNNEKQEGTTPYQVADQLNQHADKALAGIEKMDAQGHRELFKTLTDIRIMAYLGHYYGHKIRGATDLTFFRETGDLAYRKKAVDALQQAAKYWKLYASEGLLMYHNPLWTNRVGYVDWQTNLIYAFQDLDLIGAGQVLPPQHSALKGTVLEAETARMNGGTIATDIAHYVGKGYVRGAEALSWTIDIPADGRYVLHYRYARGGGNSGKIPLRIDGQVVAHLPVWYTGATSNWTVDRYVVDFTQGNHQLQLNPPESVLLDQISFAPFTLDGQ